MVWFIFFIIMLIGVVSILIQEDHPDLYQKLVLVYWLGIGGILIYISMINKDWYMLCLVLLFIVFRWLKFHQSR